MSRCLSWPMPSSVSEPGGRFSCMPRDMAERNAGVLQFAERVHGAVAADIFRTGEVGFVDVNSASAAQMLLLLQGHVLFTRQAGGMLPCPLVDFTGGFNGFLAAAYGVSSVQAAFGAPFSVSSACLHMR